MRNPKIVFITLIILWACLISSPVYGQAEQINPLLFPYVSAVKARVEQVVNAAALPKIQSKGVLKLRLLISKEGKLKDLQVVESSGQSNLDAIAIDSVQQVFPFIPFPAEIRESELWIELPVIVGKGGGVIVTYSPAVSSEKNTLLSPSAHTPSQLILQNYISAAMANFQPTKIANEQIALALLKIKEVQRNLYPSISGEYKTSDGETITDPYKSRSYGLQAEQLLLGLNQILDSVKREEIGLDMAKKNYSRLENEVRYEVIKSYYGLVAQKIMLKHWQDTLGEIKPGLELIKQLYEKGLTIAADLDNVQSQYKLIEHQMSSTEANVSLTRLSLAQAMNLGPSQLNLIDAPLEFGFEAEDLKLDLADCVDKGLRYRPEIEIWKKTCESTKINELINRRENIPKFSIATSYGRSGEAYSNQNLNLADDWSLMGKLTWLWGPNTVQLSQTADRAVANQITDTTTKTESSTSDIKISFLDRLNYYTATKEAQITHKQSLNELNETNKKVLYEIREAYAAYQKALSGMQVSLNRITYRERELKIVKARTDVGEGASTDFVEAKINLANEKASYLRSQEEYYLAVAALDKATGYKLRFVR